MNQIKQFFCFCFRKKRVQNLLNTWLYLLGLCFMIYIGHMRETNPKQLPGVKGPQENLNDGLGNVQDKTPYLDSVYFVSGGRIVENEDSR